MQIFGIEELDWSPEPAQAGQQNITQQEIQYDNGDSYYGSTNIDKKPHGPGKYVWQAGMNFQGTFELGCLKNGQLQDQFNQAVSGPISIQIPQCFQFDGTVQNGTTFIGITKLENNCVLEGSFIDGLISGRGKKNTVTLQKGVVDVWEGSFIDGNMTSGKLTKKSGYDRFQDNMVIEGEFKNEYVVGITKVLLTDGATYVGHINQTHSYSFHGHGIYTWPCGVSVQGEFEHNKFFVHHHSGQKGLFKRQDSNLDGSFSLTFPGLQVNDVTKFEGVFIAGSPISGTAEYENGTKEDKMVKKYEGDFKNFSPHGNGILTLSNGDTVSGVFKEGYIIQGKYMSISGISFDGCFKQSRIEKGLFLDSNNQIISGKIDVKMFSYYRYEGQVENGKLINGKIHVHDTYYEGQISDGLVFGVGKMVKINSRIGSNKADIIEGIFISNAENTHNNGQIKGNAKIYYGNGDFYVGSGQTLIGGSIITEMYKHGKGLLLTASGQLYGGQWTHNHNHHSCQKILNNEFPPDADEDGKKVILNRIELKNGTSSIKNVVTCNKNTSIKLQIQIEHNSRTFNGVKMLNMLFEVAVDLAYSASNFQTME